MSDKKKFTVVDGVELINGAKVPANRVVELTDSEALFDLSLGRIEPMPNKNGESEKAKAKVGNQETGGK